MTDTRLAPSLDSLSDAALECMLKKLVSEDVQDLLRFSRTSKRYNVVVLGAENVWKAAYDAHFGPLPSVDSAASAATSSTCSSWHARYKHQFLEHATHRRRKLAARRLKATSAVQTLEQEIYRLSNSLSAEQHTLQTRKEQLETLESAQKAALMQHAHIYWVPVAVMRAQGSVVMQLPQDAEERERTLQEKVSLGNFEVEKLTKMLAARIKALDTARAKLGALQP